MGWLSACNTDGGAGTISTVAPMEAKFDPSASVIPFPNNILFAGTLDGTLNIPVVNPADYSDPKVAMNTLDGFSTIAPITTTFSLPIDAATVPAGVRVFEVNTAGLVNSYAVTGIVGELQFGTQFVALPSPGDARTLVVKPVVPLASNSNFMVVVTKALKSTSGQPAVPSAVFRLLKNPNPLVNGGGVSQVPGVDDATAQQLEGLRQLTGAMLLVGGTAAPAVNPADVAIVWSFKTQTATQVLANIQAQIAADPYANSAANFITVAAQPSTATGGLGVLDIYSFVVANDPYGTLGLQDAYANGSFANLGSVAIGAAKQSYYLDDTSVNPLGPLTSFFQIDVATGLPVVKSMQAEPFLVTIPNSAGPWPVVIFQHGITVDKSAVMGIANTLAKAGFATVAMDLVLHGDRTFGLDLIDNTTGAPGPDGIADPSGQHFINLTSLLTSRDNLRQSVADLMHLSQLLSTQAAAAPPAAMDVVNNTNGQPGADGIADLSVGGPTPVSFVGHSLGAMVGGVLAGVDPSILTYVMANPGGETATLLKDSATFGPIIDAGLAANGVMPGSADYDAFFVAAQTVVDDGDPVNYAGPAVLAGKNLLLFKTLDDQVIPNAQTDTLALSFFGMAQVMATPAAGWPGGFSGSPYSGTPAFTFFTAGTHSSFLTPEPAPPSLVGLDVITEMQSETANYLGSALAGSATVVIGATPLPSGGSPIGIMQ